MMKMLYWGFGMDQSTMFRFKSLRFYLWTTEIEGLDELVSIGDTDALEYMNSRALPFPI